MVTLVEKARHRTEHNGRNLRQYSIVISFLALFIVLSLLSDNFLTPINLINTMESGSIYGIVAVALTLLLIVGEFDLSVGAIYVLSGIIAAKLFPFIGAGPALALGAMSGLGVGLFNGLVVTRFGVNSFIATLATSLMLVGAGTLITDGFQLYTADPGFGLLGNALVFGIPCFVWIFCGLALGFGFLLARTRLGRWIYVVGGNREAARLSGISVDAIRVGAFCLSGLAASIAGAIIVSRTGTAIAGNGLSDVLFPAIAAVVVGGTSIQGGYGAVWRTVIGIFFLELIRNGFNLLELNPYYQDIVRGGIILLAVGADALSRKAI